MLKALITVSCSLLLLAALPSRAHTPAAEGCGASASEYSTELVLMRSAASSIGAPASAAPVPLELDRRYAISLDDESKLRFRMAPGRTSRAANARGGVFSFRTKAAGLYRVSLTSRHWIDLIDGDSMVESRRHFGPSCALIHKIVEFELPAERQIFLQLSGRDDVTVGLAITAAPAVAMTRQSTRPEVTHASWLESEAAAEPVARR